MTERAELVDALNIAFAQKYHSMAQFVLDAEPYVKPGREGLLAAIRDVAGMDQRAAGQIAEAIEQLEGIAQPGTGDPSLAAYHYLDLDFLAATLADALEQQKSYYGAMRQRFGSGQDAEAIFSLLGSVTEEQISRLQKARS